MIVYSLPSIADGGGEKMKKRGFAILASMLMLLIAFSSIPADADGDKCVWIKGTVKGTYFSTNPCAQKTMYLEDVPVKVTCRMDGKIQTVKTTSSKLFDLIPGGDYESSVLQSLQYKIEINIRKTIEENKYDFIYDSGWFKIGEGDYTHNVVIQGQIVKSRTKEVNNILLYMLSRILENRPIFAKLF